MIVNSLINCLIKRRLFPLINRSSIYKNPISYPYQKQTFYSSKNLFTSDINQFINLQATFPSRTHTCGDLRSSHVNQRVVLSGWSQRIRKFSPELIFLPIRDSYGTTQLVYRSSKSSDDASLILQEKLSQLSAESVICIEGVVAQRPKETINKNMLTGEIEVEIEKLYCLNPAYTLPFFPFDKKLSNEETRLRHRYIDLRRDILQNNLRKRSLVSWSIRDFLVNEGFVEIETPILFKSTPEGAREFIVPTRTKGLFYALTQSPQQYKQLLMAGGIDKYFQIAKCFRDEDLRADRQPEFTQIDLEMSFVKVDDIISLVEKMLVYVWKKVLGVDLTNKVPFQRMTFNEAMSKFGSDKPDTRYGMEIKDISSFISDLSDLSEYYAECLVIKNGATLLSKKEIESLKSLNNPSEDSETKCEFHMIRDNKLNSWFFDSHILKQSSNLYDSFTKEFHIEIGDLVIMNKRKKNLVRSWTLLGRIRSQIITLLQLKDKLSISPLEYNFLWIESFPLFTRVETNKLTSTHHPFTAPLPEDIELLFKDPEQVRGQSYDLVLNGVEIGGGSVRIHSPKLQSMIFSEILKLSNEEIIGFEHLVNALGYGCPPHGGIALGFDRLLAVMCETKSIKDVIAFPKTASGNDITVSSPSKVSKEILEEYGIQLI
ncbi:tRNA synthetases class II-domain-containing protein [Glomus cerebriforme]|uniref:tRNA synthetases class II-domain-containing protein n=1 Tax=Glomus cerebriforme TaxID=658196 RepID=A0A397T8R8_9GLOM|nr:tRNA synthetases class II-domain-containing protein [Glomus cerebriforme]